MNRHAWFSSVGSSYSNCGWAIGRIRARAAAFQNHPEMWLSTASA